MSPIVQISDKPRVPRSVQVPTLRPCHRPATVIHRDSEDYRTAVRKEIEKHVKWREDIEDHLRQCPRKGVERERFEWPRRRLVRFGSCRTGDDLGSPATLSDAPLTQAIDNGRSGSLPLF